jgi:hypothetical protein
MRSLRQAVAVLAICGSFVSVVAFNAASEEFLAKYLGGRFEPPTADEGKLLASVKQ